MTGVVSIAYIRPDEGKDKDTLNVLSELYTLLRRKNYSRDFLYRDAKNPGQLINLRYWTSGEARQEASEDPEIHRLWQRLSQVSTVDGVIENLELIEGPWSS